VSCPLADFIASAIGVLIVLIALVVVVVPLAVAVVL
jgi:hypothetical protein